jgi:hypothetical protein
MARINDGTLKDWKDGDKVTSDLYEADREILRVATNDNHDRITVLEVDKPIQDKRLDDLEYNTTGTVVPMTFKELGMQNLTFDDIKLGYVDKAIEKAWKPSLDGLTIGVVEEVTATNGQTVINLANSYTPGSFQLTVEIDGVPQDETSYTETSTTSITLSESLVAGQRVVVTIGKIDPNADARFSSLTTQMAEKAKQSEMPTYVNIKSFGAKGDGITDDSVAFKTAFTSGVEGLFIPAGTYIINIQAGTSNASRDFISNTNVYNVSGIKGKSVIKLGSGNGNEVNYTGFQSLFNYNGADVDICWENITFDFNYANNIPQHYTGQYTGVEINGQQMAINCYHIRDLTVRNCKFIEQSGTNCINYRSSASNKRNAMVVIEKNQFLDMGKVSKYNNAGTLVDAYHDCSTLSIHVDTALSNNIVTSYIKENVFIGAGHNAYDVCEVGTNVHYFKDNHIENYCIGFMPLGSTPNVESHCVGNTMLNMRTGINIWNGIVDVNTTENDLAFKMLEIKDNTIHVNPVYHMYTPAFNATNIVNGVVTDHVFCIMKWGGTPSRSIDKMIIKDNVFEYYKDATVTGYNATLTTYSGSGICFYQQFSGSVLTGFTKNPFLTDFEVSRNKFINIWRTPILMLTYPKMDRIKIEDNLFYGCNFDTVYNNPAAQLVDIRLFGNAVAPYNVNANLNCYNEFTKIANNVFTKVDPTNKGVRLSINQNAYSVANSFFVFKNNIFDVTPYTYYSAAVSSGTAPSVITDATNAH